MDRVWSFLHLFFAFSFVGALVLADWNGRAARATTDWRQRALLLAIIGRASRVGAAGSLFLTGLLGNLMLSGAGYRMATDVWPRWVNGVWVVAMLVLFGLCLPAIRTLESVARGAAEGQTPAGYEDAMRRWRAGNLMLSLLYLVLLWLMVYRWN